MLASQDFTQDIDERKTVRKELKQKPTVANVIKQAAAALGMDESTFINSAAYQKAQEVMQSQFVTRLDAVAFDAFAQAVDAEGARHEALATAMKNAQERFIDK